DGADHTAGRLQPLRSAVDDRAEPVHDRPLCPAALYADGGGGGPVSGLSGIGALAAFDDAGCALTGAFFGVIMLGAAARAERLAAPVRSPSTADGNRCRLNRDLSLDIRCWILRLARSSSHGNHGRSGNGVAKRPHGFPRPCSLVTAPWALW